ncbi:MAG: SH3 domain-containing protein, partial [Deltaproteobacteria bacterium]|nr:SH3 domain-containing protein [Deltaproteobacteria bacterium]
MKITGMKPQVRVGKISQQNVGYNSTNASNFTSFVFGDSHYNLPIPLRLLVTFRLFACGIGVSRIKLFCLIVMLFFLSGCLRLTDTIKDERDLRQDHAAYLNETAKEKVLLPAEAQAKMDADYNTTYFSVWHKLQPIHAFPERVSFLFKKFSMSLGYGENKKKHSAEWLKKLQQNAFLDNYPNTLHLAITTRSTNLRMLPTQGPHFYRPDGDISGWPFDNLQISSVAANTPVFVCHLSAD